MEVRTGNLGYLVFRGGQEEKWGFNRRHKRKSQSGEESGVHQRGRGGEACTLVKVSVVRNCWRPWRLAKELRRASQVGPC